MPPTEFKVTHINGQKRLARFSERPDWATLATRLSNLLALPIQNIGVSYLDSDGDEITLNSQGELVDYYASHPNDQVVNFQIRDLSSRNLSGGEASNGQKYTDDLDFGDWQNLPEVNLLGLDVRSGPPASTEPLPSDTPHVTAGALNAAVSVGQSTPRIPTAEKGKAKEPSVDDASTRSVLNDSTPIKPPVHVYDASHTSPPLEQPTAAQQTANVQGREGSGAGTATGAGSVPVTVDDPPLPEFSAASGSAPQSSPSFAQDLANFLIIFNTAVASHPELGAAFRNLMRNTSEGVYWAAQRDSFVNSAEQFAQNTARMAGQWQRAAETEAAQRVSNTLDALFRGLSQMGAPAPPPPPAPAPAPAPTPPNPPVTPQMPSLFNHFPFSFPPAAPPQNLSESILGPTRRHTTSGTDPGMFGGLAASSGQDQRAKLEAVKQMYKAEKERYKEEQRRKRRDSSAHDGHLISIPPKDDEIERIVSKARGDYPPLEYVPLGPVRRHNTHLGHGSNASAEHSLNARAAERIRSRLEDLGITADEYTDLKNAIQGLLPSNNVVLSTEMEDSIVDQLVRYCFAEAARKQSTDGPSGAI